MLQVLISVYFSLCRLDEVEDAVNINDKLNQTVKNKDEKIVSLETRSYNSVSTNLLMVAS